MLKAKDVMTTPVVSVDPDDSIEKTIRLMLDHRVSGLPVIDRSGHLVGIISEYDLLDLAWDSDRADSEVYQYMTCPVHTVEEQDDLGCVAERFRLFGIRRLPVMRGDRVVGIVSRHDLLAHLTKTRAQRVAA